MEKEQWKDEILNSLQGLQQAEPSPFLFTRIEAQLQTRTGLSKLQVRLAAACLLALLVINIWMVGNFSENANLNSNTLTTSYRF